MKIETNQTLVSFLMHLISLKGTVKYWMHEMDAQTIVIGLYEPS